MSAWNFGIAKPGSTADMSRFYPDGKICYTRPSPPGKIWVLREPDGKTRVVGGFPTERSYWVYRSLLSNLTCSAIEAADIGEHFLQEWFQKGEWRT